MQSLTLTFFQVVRCTTAPAAMGLCGSARRMARDGHRRAPNGRLVACEHKAMPPAARHHLKTIAFKSKFANCTEPQTKNRGTRAPAVSGHTTTVFYRHCSNTGSVPLPQTRIHIGRDHQQVPPFCLHHVSAGCREMRAPEQTEGDPGPIAPRCRLTLLPSCPAVLRSFEHAGPAAAKLSFSSTKSTVVHGQLPAR